MDPETAGAGGHAAEDAEGAVPARRGRPRDSRAGRPGRRAAARADVAGAAVVGPRRLRDLRPHGVRRHRVPRAGQLPPRARRRDRAHHRDDRRKWPAPACTSRWARTRCSASRGRPRRRSSSSCAAARPLSPSTIAGITDLVAASVEGLRPGSGRHPRQLRPSAVEAAERRGRRRSARAQLERQQRLERDMATRVVAHARAGRRRRPRARQRRASS